MNVVTKTLQIQVSDLRIRETEKTRVRDSTKTSVPNLKLEALNLRLILVAMLIGVTLAVDVTGLKSSKVSIEILNF